MDLWQNGLRWEGVQGWGTFDFPEVVSAAYQARRWEGVQGSPGLPPPTPPVSGPGPSPGAQSVVSPFLEEAGSKPGATPELPQNAHQRVVSPGAVTRQGHLSCSPHGTWCWLRGRLQPQMAPDSAGGAWDAVITLLVQVHGPDSGGALS